MLLSEGAGFDQLNWEHWIARCCITGAAGKKDVCCNCGGSVHSCGQIMTGSLSTRVFETRTATGREHFTCQDSGVSQIFVLIISNGEKILSNVNVAVRKQVKRENSSLPVAVRVSKTCVLKLPKVLAGT